MLRQLAIWCVLALAAAAPVAARAGDNSAAIVIRAGKSDSVNHALALQFAGAIAGAANGALTLDVQESQGSIANVQALDTTPANYLFTAGPAVITAARRGQKPFTREPRYHTIRALFPIPAETVTWVVQRDSPVHDLADLAGRNLIAGPKGSISERVTTEALQALGIDREVHMLDLEPKGALQALASNQVAAVALAGPYPLPALKDFATKTPIRLLSLPVQQLGEVLASDDSLAAEVVPRAAYGTATDAVTLALPAGVYTTTRMSDRTAYLLTKAFWSALQALARRAPQWQAVSAGSLITLDATLHRGALRYYREAKMPVPKALRGERTRQPAALEQ